MADSSSVASGVSCWQPFEGRCSNVSTVDHWHRVVPACYVNVVECFDYYGGYSDFHPCTRRSGRSSEDRIARRCAHISTSVFARERAFVPEPYLLCCVMSM